MMLDSVQAICGQKGRFPVCTWQFTEAAVWTIDYVKVLVVVIGPVSFTISTAIVDGRSVAGGDLN